MLKFLKALMGMLLCSRIDSKIVQKISVQPKSNIIQQGNNE